MVKKIIKSSQPNILYSDDGSHLQKENSSNKLQEVKPELFTLRIRIEKNHRGGKTVTVIYELPANNDYNQQLCKKLKNMCGSGGSFKEQRIEIQGDHRSKCQNYLEQAGFKVILSGG